MVCAHYCAAYSKQSYIVHKTNMWYPCYMMLFILDPSTLFSASCDLTLILCSKNRKIKK